MRIDLHTHSDRSDGTQSPAEVIASAAAADLDVVALTDHDTTSGWDEAVAALQEHPGLRLITGTEVTARMARPGTWGIPVHLLSYLQNPDHPELLELLELNLNSRQHRIGLMVERLQQDFPITEELVFEQVAPGATVGRPHVADTLVHLGVVAERSQAFEQLLAPGSPYYVPTPSPLATDVVRAIRAAGGVAVIAHPAARERGYILDDDEIATLAAAGLQGLEVYHRDHEAGDRQRLLRLAEELGLFVTGSSDYHGAGKPNRLGENLTAPEVLDQIIDLGWGPVYGPN